MGSSVIQNLCTAEIIDLSPDVAGKLENSRENHDLKKKEL